MIISHTNSQIKEKVLIPAHIIQALSEIGREHMPKEFGGILTGYKVDGIEIIIDFEVPTEYEQTKTSFTRFPDSLNDYLKGIHEMSSGQLQYLGEWHTHPNSRPVYSKDDFGSIHEIAKDKSSKNEEPLLMILGLSQDSFSYNLYKYYDPTLLQLENNK